MLLCNVSVLHLRGSTCSLPLLLSLQPAPTLRNLLPPLKRLPVKRVVHFTNLTRGPLRWVVTEWDDMLLMCCALGARTGQPG